MSTDTHPATITRQVLRDIEVAIAEMDGEDARSMLQLFRQEFGKICRKPEIGDLRDDLGHEVRCHLMFSHLAFYSVNSGKVLLLRVLDERLDYIGHPWP